MIKIALQAGHQNIASNCVPKLRPGTGAPGERDINVRVRDQLSKVLLSKKNKDGSQAFQVFLYDANTNCDQKALNQDYGLFLSLHCEADVHGKGGGFITAPDPAYDDVNAESRRISSAIEADYFNHSGIEKHQEWITTNMTQYYMWSELSSKTPCTILEMGVAQNAHDKVILADTDRVANAIARGICRAFNVPFDEPIVNPPSTDWEQKYNAEVSAHNATKEKIKRAQEVLK